MAPALVTLVMGIVLGYLAQRSRFCLIGGLRDFILVHDTELLKGAAAFFITAWLAFSVASVFGGVDFQGPQLQQTVQAGVTPVVTSGPAAMSNAAGVVAWLAGINWSRWALMALAGIGLGLFSTVANGCPTRQHILAAQGMQDSLLYLAGFYLGVIVFYLITRPLIASFM